MYECLTGEQKIVYSFYTWFYNYEFNNIFVL
jgi:hypothetical protein